MNQDVGTHPVMTVTVDEILAIWDGTDPDLRDQFLTALLAKLRASGIVEGRDLVALVARAAIERGRGHALASLVEGTRRSLSSSGAPNETGAKPDHSLSSAAGPRK
jgi:MoxR-like ATPase